MRFMPVSYAPSGFAASNLIPWPAVTQNREAIRYYQRVLTEYGHGQPLNADGVWGPATQQSVAGFQASSNRTADRLVGTIGDVAGKVEIVRTRTDGVLDEATQANLQSTWQAQRVPRGSFTASRPSSPAAAPSTVHSFVGGTTPSTYTAPVTTATVPKSTPSALTPAPLPAVTYAQPAPIVAAPAEFPWVPVLLGGAAVVGLAWWIVDTKGGR